MSTSSRRASRRVQCTSSRIVEPSVQTVELLLAPAERDGRGGAAEVLGEEALDACVVVAAERLQPVDDEAVEQQVVEVDGNRGGQFFAALELDHQVARPQRRAQRLQPRGVWVRGRDRAVAPLEINEARQPPRDGTVVLSLGNARAVSMTDHADVDVAAVDLGQRDLACRLVAGAEVLHADESRRAHALQRLFDGVALSA